MWENVTKHEANKYQFPVMHLPNHQESLMVLYQVVIKNKKGKTNYLLSS